jgi:hypothetical protein
MFGETRNTYQILGGKPRERRRPVCGWQGLGAIGCKDVNWIRIMSRFRLLH